MRCGVATVGAHKPSCCKLPTVRIYIWRISQGGACVCNRTLTCLTHRQMRPEFNRVFTAESEERAVAAAFAGAAAALGTCGVVTSARPVSQTAHENTIKAVLHQLVAKGGKSCRGACSVSLFCRHAHLRPYVHVPGSWFVRGSG